MSKIFIGFLVIGAIMLVIPISLAWSGTRRRVRVERVDGVAELRMPRGHWAILGVLAFLPGAAITGFSVAVDWAPGSEVGKVVMAVIFALAALSAGGYLIGLEVRGALRLSETTIERRGVFTTLTARWTDVAKINFNSMNNWFFLTLVTGDRIYVTEGSSGLGDFGELALKHLPKAVLEASPEAVEALEDAASMGQPKKK
jgi:hypothetical protein